MLKLLERKNDKKTKPFRHVDVYDEVKRLIKEKKADPNTRNKDGYTAVQLAVRNEHFDCLETLIRDGDAKLDKRGP